MSDFCGFSSFNEKASIWFCYGLVVHEDGPSKMCDMRVSGIWEKIYMV